MLTLLNCHDEVTRQAILRRVSLTSESKNGAWLHAGLHFDFFFYSLLSLCFSITLRHLLHEAECLGRAVEELLEGAAALHIQIAGMSFLPLCDSFTMQVALNLLDHLDLLAFFIECDSVGVAGSEENFKDLEGITVESVA